jgi:hypothetical protein
MQRPQAFDMSRVLPGPQIIRQSVNDVQRKCESLVFWTVLVFRTLKLIL